MPQRGTRWEKSPARLIERFGMILERFPDLEQRRMFGFPAAFAASGHLVSGLHGPAWIVRLGEADQTVLRELGGDVFHPGGGRPMTGFLTLPNDIVTDDREVAKWIGLARTFVATLPAKKPRQTSKRTKTPKGN